MYSKDERLKAVELLIQYDMMYSVVIRELGYPHINSLRKWYREYVRNGDVHECCTRKSKYTSADKQYAVNYYLEHGKCVSRTCKKLGYPSRSVLNAWIEELAPQQKKNCASGGRNVEYTQEQKQSAVIDMYSRTGSVSQVAEKHGVTQPTLYKWKKSS